MNELAVSIGVILFPGLIACIICDKIAAHGLKWGTFKYGVYSFVFGVSCYAATQIASYLRNAITNLYFHSAWPDPPLHVWAMVTAHKVDINFAELSFATLLAPGVAAAVTFINDRHFLNRWAQRVGVSAKYGDENLFSHYLNSEEITWVYIRDIATNQTYKGSVLSWSETDNMQEIVLSDVTVYEYETSTELYSLPSIYLARSTGTFVIEAVA